MFAFAGIALVILLLVLRLTVAAGTIDINGVIFYANVVAVSSATFFQPQASSISTVLMAKVLTVFIAWLNLDLEIETCFYNDICQNMAAVCLSPLYIWVLVGLIILGSHYSGRVAQIFGSNPSQSWPRSSVYHMPNCFVQLLLHFLTHSWNILTIYRLLCGCMMGTLHTSAASTSHYSQLQWSA